jgi:hypothetical protein
MMSINPDKITMLKTYETSIEVIDEWFRLLSKREKIIVLAMHHIGHTEDFQDARNVELVLMSGIPPKRRYEKNGVPFADYPSFDEIKDSDLITIWNSLSIEERLILFSTRCNNLCQQYFLKSWKNSLNGRNLNNNEHFLSKF